MKKTIIAISAGCIAMLCAFLFLHLAAPTAPKATPSSTAQIDPKIKQMLGQMIMTGFRGDGRDVIGDAPYITELARKGKIGGVILFNTDVEQKTINRNTVDKKQLQMLISNLQNAAAIPLFIAVDQEGGQVQRLKPSHGFTRWPYPEDMARMSDDIVEQIGLEMGQELKSVGINLNFAPGIDVNINPKSPVIGMIGRSFSKKPEIVAQKASAFMTGLNKAGVSGCFKHFPGHGSAMADTHNGAADVSNTWQKSELEPYQLLLGMPGSYGVMVAHVYNPAFGDSYPATLSPSVIEGLLRTNLGWPGVVFTDDMQMQAITAHYSLEEAVRLAVLAGADVLVFGNNYGYKKDIAEDVYNALLNLYAEGKLSTERIEKSYTRIMALKKQMALPVEQLAEQSEQEK